MNWLSNLFKKNREKTTPQATQRVAVPKRNGHNRVRGHWRRYKNGKKVFVKEFGRNNNGGRRR